MNKKTIITVLLVLVAITGISNAFDFSIDDEDVTIAVNKDVAGYDIPNKETAVGEATFAVRFLETKGGHVGVNHNKELIQECHSPYRLNDFRDKVTKS